MNRSSKIWLNLLNVSNEESVGENAVEPNSQAIAAENQILWIMQNPMVTPSSSMERNRPRFISHAPT
jgi:hypothetical protein